MASHTGGSTRPALVAVVDDDAAVRDALRFAFELDGYQVQTFASGEDLLSGDLPSEGVCVILDHRLPGLAGLDVYRRLRERRADLPAVLITSHPRPELQRAAEAAGVPIVEKPLLGDGLAAAVRAALARGH